MGVTHEQALLRAVCESPFDDAARLLAADWYEERGDPRGEFIRVQVALARLPAGDCSPEERASYSCPRCERKDALRRRERELLERQPAPDEAPEKNRRLWAWPIYRFASDWEFRRGFVEAVHCTLSGWYGAAGGGRGPAAVLAAPVAEVRADKRPDPVLSQNGVATSWNWWRSEDKRGGPSEIPLALYRRLNPPRWSGLARVSNYDAEADAVNDLSRALVGWAREKAGLPPLARPEEVKS
jgi:uncharacterized protein (TIGR02996 family)